MAADGGSHWVEGAYDVYLLRGNCYINQGLTYARSREAVLWIERGGAGRRAAAQGDRLSRRRRDDQLSSRPAQAAHESRGDRATLTDKTWFGRFYSVHAGRRAADASSTPPPAAKPGSVTARRGRASANARRQRAASAVRRADHSAAADRRPAAGHAAHPRARPQRRRMPTPRSTRSIPATNEVVVIVKSGVNIIVDGLDNFGSIDVDTDNLVIWTEGAVRPQCRRPVDAAAAIGRWKSTWKATSSSARATATIYAQRMYYDVRRQTGIVLAAEVLTPVPKLRGPSSSCGPT